MVPNPSRTQFDAGLKEPVTWGYFQLHREAKNGNHQYIDLATGKKFRKTYVDRFIMESSLGQTMTERRLWYLFEKTEERKWLTQMFRLRKFQSVTATVADRDGITEAEARKRLIDHLVERQKLPSEQRDRTPFIIDSP